MSKSLSIPAFLSLFVVGVVALLAPARAQDSSAPAQPPAAAPADPNTPADGDKLVYVKMTTSKGPIVIELNETRAPISTANFLGYVDEGFYNGTIFHRVMPNFMIQGGGFEPGGSQKTTKDPIKNEWQNGLKNKRGAIAMARTGHPDSATAQFFINVVDNAALDTPRRETGNAAYAVFGRVVEGMETVDAIKASKTAVRGPHRDWPVEDVMIEKVERMPEGFKPSAS